MNKEEEKAFKTALEKALRSTSPSVAYERLLQFAKTSMGFGDMETTNTLVIAMEAVRKEHKLFSGS